MVKYMKATPGKKFTLTELGLEQSRVRAKFEDSSELKSKYQQAVPTTWVEKGYVKEIEYGR